MGGKVIRVEMPDGYEWFVPAKVVIDHRAAYYATRDPGADESDPPNDEILDWASNNMNWEDVRPFAARGKQTASFDYEDGWINGEKRVMKAPPAPGAPGRA